MKRLLLPIFLILFISTGLFSQTTYNWRSEAGGGNWNDNNHWWDGGATNKPGGADIIRFNNDAFTSMTNDLPATNRFQIYFDNGASAPRTIGGSTKNTFFDFGGGTPKIENTSTANHTIGFPIELGHDQLELNPVNGNLTVTGTITQEGTESNFIDVYGINTLTITSDYLGTGGLAVKTGGTVVFSGTDKSYTGNTFVENGVLRTSVSMESAIIQVQNGGRLEIDGNVSVKELIIQNGGALEILSGSLTIEGNFQNSGALTHNNLPVTFGGSATQTISGTSETEFYDVIINNASGVNLAQNFSVANQMDFTAGKFTLGSNNITVNTSATVTNSGMTKYVVTDGTGVLTREGVGAAGKMFPVGTTSSYAPVTITNDGTIDNFSVLVDNTVTSPADATKIINLEWNITEATGGGSDVTLDLQWNTSDEAASFDNAGTVVIGHFSGGAWEESVATVSGSDPYIATVGGFSSFSPFAVGNQAALPVELVRFEVENKNNAHQLNWTTASEINNAYFEVQHSTNNRNWQSLGQVQGAGNAHEINHYDFLNAKPTSGMNYYRLKQMDYDGQFDFSKIVSIHFEKEEAGQIFPNPVLDELSIKLQNTENQTITNHIYNVNGQLIQTQTAFLEDGYLQLNTAELKTGIYFLQILDEVGNAVLQEQFVKR